MHDPMVIAFDVRRPWPQLRKLAPGDARLERRGFRFPFAYVGNRELYWPSFITVWHVEPGGADALTVCKSKSHWQLHVHHWRIQVHPLQRLRRRLLTRCVECGGRSTRKNPTNISHQWHSDKAPWWRGEPGLFHRECSAIASRRRRETRPSTRS